jgi:calcium-binding protein CML
MVDTERYAASFAMLDRDGDGRVTSSEFQELMASIGVEFTDEAAVKAIEMMDTDGDGLVTLEELARYLSLPHVNTDDPTPPQGTAVAEAPPPDPSG